MRKDRFQSTPAFMHILISYQYRIVIQYETMPQRVGIQEHRQSPKQEHSGLTITGPFDHSGKLEKDSLTNYKNTRLNTHGCHLYPYLCDMKPLCALLLSLVFIPACKKTIETISPVRENITESVYASGILKSKNQYQVFASVNGLLQKIYVQEGDTVKKGTPLFSILNETSKLYRENAQLNAALADSRANEIKLNELKLNIDLAKSKLANDSMLMVRQQSLWDQNLGSKVELEKSILNFQNSKTTYTTAKLRYEDEKRRLDILSKQARKNLQISERNESDFTITSTIDGKVYDLYKEQGEMITPQMPLGIIGDLKDFILELQVDEYDITVIKPGQEVKVTMDSYKGEVFDAIVTRVYPIMNERTKSATVEAVFTHPPAVLYPNLTLEANILLQVKENVLTIPRSYLLKDRYVIRESGDTIEVKTGIQDYLKAEILDGITEKDILIPPGS